MVIAGESHSDSCALSYNDSCDLYPHSPACNYTGPTLHGPDTAWKLYWSDATTWLLPNVNRILTINQ